VAIDALGTVASTTTSSSTSSLNLQDFMTILASQLNNQDPLKPMDNQEFMGQLAQFTALEQTQQLNTNIQSLLSIQSATQSVGLIGRTVSLTSNSGTTSGSVTELDFSSGEPRMTILTDAGATLTDVRMSQITTVR
jgi:flagellar basal-body rod modification protein FlgD